MKREGGGVNYTDNYVKNECSLPGWQECKNIKFLATSNGKNAWAYVQRRGMWNTHRYMNLEGSGDILACRQQKYTCFHRFQPGKVGEIAPCLTLALLRVFYAHRSRSEFETESQCRDRWRGRNIHTGNGSAATYGEPHWFPGWGNNQKKKKSWVFLSSKRKKVLR